MNNIIKNQNRLHTFHYLTRHAGKGVNGCLKKLIIKEDKGKLSTLVDRESIEEEIIQYNKQFFKKPTEMKVFNNKIYKRLNELSI